MLGSSDDACPAGSELTSAQCQAYGLPHVQSITATNSFLQSQGMWIASREYSSYFPGCIVGYDGHVFFNTLTNSINTAGSIIRNICKKIG